MRKTAEAGVPYEDIAAAMVSPELLENPVLRERLKAEVEAGNTRHRIDLRMAVRKKGIVRGSVTALSLAARNTPLIDWDQNVVPHQAAPDLTGVAERLATIIEKLAAKMRPS